MSRRITVQMINAKKPNKEVTNKIIDDWMNEIVKSTNDDGLLNYMMIQITGALALDKITDKDRINIIRNAFKTAGLSIFTPRAYEEIVTAIKEDVNGTAQIEKVPTYVKNKNGDLVKKQIVVVTEKE